MIQSLSSHLLLWNWYFNFNLDSWKLRRWYAPNSMYFRRDFTGPRNSNRRFKRRMVRRKFNFDCRRYYCVCDRWKQLYQGKAISEIECSCPTKRCLSIKSITNGAYVCLWSFSRRYRCCYDWLNYICWWNSYCWTRYCSWWICINWRTHWNQKKSSIKIYNWIKSRSIFNFWF